MLSGRETGEPSLITASERLRGFEQALSARHVTVDPDLVLEAGSSIEGGRLAMIELIENRRMPSAILAGCDETAFGALMALRDLGLSAPKNVSIIGIDDHQMSWFLGLSTISQPVADQGLLYGMFGEGRVAFIDARDIAAAAAELLTSPGHQGASYTLTGPEALSAAEVAERLSAATGRQVRSVDLGPDGYRQALAGAGMPGWLVDGVVEGNTMLAAGHGATVTDEVARLTGRPPRTFAQFAADHREEFGGQPS